ncbi:MAG TPA: alkaline phosphatase family protein [Polyangia bacterium]|jgi:phospholipase C|nr:alkaline phosphatase family protein [Polyangia bacterium]
MSKTDQPTRRAALKLGLGVGAAAFGLDACGAAADRCPPGPIASGAAPGALSGIDTIVVVMMENRSFDHLIGALATDPSYPGASVVDGLTGTETNLDSSGLPVTVNLAPAETSKLDPKHDWDSSHRAFNGGRNDGFVIVNPGANQAEVMSYHQRATAPFLYGLCDQYTVCDRWFSSVMGPTWPNRYYLHAATAAGHKTNLPMGLDPPPTVWQRLAERCVPAGYYYAGNIPWYSVTFPANSFSGNDAVAPQTIDHFFTDAAGGALPSFSIIDPNFGVNDGHPPYDFSLAEAFMSSIHRALVASVHWPRALLVIMFDEHGGYFDHVPPPTVPDSDPDFRQIGFRVPAVVVGPQVRAGAVVSTPYDHVSVLATLATRFGIAGLGPRMDAASDLSACIDPDRSSVMAPTASLPPTVEIPASVIRSAPFRLTSQPELEALARAGGVPAHHVDPRGPTERLQAWLRHAQALEAVRIVG